MADANVEAVVVGSGPGGSVAALLLAALGREVVVLEREAADGLAQGAGILLQPNGLAVLYGLGLREALMEEAVVYGEAPFCNERGAVLGHVTIPDFGEGLDHALAMRRSALTRILDEALRRPGVEVRHRSKVVGVDTAAGDVELEASDGRLIIGAQLVIGADGIGSQVRRSGGFDGRVRPTGQTYARLVVDGTVGMPGAEHWTRLGLFGSSPVGGDQTYAFASVTHPDVRAAVDHGDLDRFVDLWTDALPISERILERLESIGDLLINDVARVTCRRYHDGRAVLLGDAAHAMAPNLGQGANSAFVDAAVLAQELAATSDQAEALRRFDRRRRRPVRSVQRNADRLARVAHLHNPAARAVRDRMARLVNRPALVARQVRAAQQVDPADLLRTVRVLTGSRQP